MADRRDSFFRQIVTETELDEMLNDMEVADQNFSADFGFVKNESAPDEEGGIVYGWVATNPSALDIQFNAGVGAIASGQRIPTIANLTIDITKTGVTPVGQDGTPSGSGSVNTDPGVGNERWVSIFIAPDRLLEDPRVDGYGTTIFYDRLESFHFHVTMGVAKTISALLISDKPPRETDELLLIDVKIQNVATVISVSALDTTRREDWFKVTGAGAAAKQITQGNPRAAIKDLLNYYSNHVSDAADPHTAAGLSYAGGPNWADVPPTTNPATNIEAQMDKVISDLASVVTPSGAEKIGAAQLTSTGSTPSSPLTPLPVGNIETQIQALLDAINGRIYRGGDTGIGGALVPTSAGTDLGASGNEWDLWLDFVRSCAGVDCDWIPNGTRDLGDATHEWDDIYVNKLNAVSANIVAIKPLVDGGSSSLGVAGVHWDMYARDIKWQNYPTLITVGGAPTAAAIRDNIGAMEFACQGNVPPYAPEFIYDMAPINNTRFFTRILVAGTEYFCTRNIRLPHGSTLNKLKVGIVAGHVNQVGVADYFFELIKFDKSTGVGTTVGTIWNPTVTAAVATYKEYDSLVDVPIPAYGEVIDNLTYCYYVLVQCQATAVTPTAGDQFYNIIAEGTYNTFRLD